MHGFDFELSTNIHFGKGKIQGLPEEILKFGCRILLVYDVAAGRKSGAYEEVRALCKEHHIHVTEFTGIEQNPKHTAVNEGVRLLKECGAGRREHHRYGKSHRIFCVPQWKLLGLL